ncbi:hypothetical protein ACFQFQ_11065 [Sulfitobacter porphyrae]|uniref:Uncharacterized protein n=1 Tax=Sulfitobacter porphyrae TaxID=1246864 RepID=A0ABW2B2H5_9RHOB|nr:hypothetical protein GCM10007928_20350 [Sulfitobacter porphyrae]
MRKTHARRPGKAVPRKGMTKCFCILPRGCIARPEHSKGPKAKPKTGGQTRRATNRGIEWDYLFCVGWA